MSALPNPLLVQGTRTLPKKLPKSSTQSKSQHTNLRIVFAFMGLLCVLSPLLVNCIGVKYTLVLGTMGWSVYSAALCECVVACWNRISVSIPRQTKIIDMALSVKPYRNVKSCSDLSFSGVVCHIW